MPSTRNPLTLLSIGAVLGGILGAVVGIAIGSTAGGSTAAVRVKTVVSTRTVRVAGSTAPVSPALPNTTPTDTTGASTDTIPSTTTDTTTTDTTTTDTTTAPTTTTTDTTTTPVQPNDVPPPDPNNPPRDFCTTHVCGPGFSRGNGYAVQCADGVWSMQGGTSGACRNDGGLA